MRRLCPSRFAPILCATLSVVFLAGCPELNHWSGPTQDPFFSVRDPAADAVLRDLEKQEKLKQPVVQVAADPHAS